MIKQIITLLICVFLLFSACTEKDIDTEKPRIDAEYNNAFPSYCDTLFFGESFTFKALFSDNNELGDYSIDIHNNFKQHSHSHRIEECNLDTLKKEPVNDFVFLEDYEIPEGIKEYKASLNIHIPKENTKGLYDKGDYHFQIHLTDKEGWSTTLGLSVKLMYR